MTTLDELVAQKEALERKINEVRKAKIKGAIAQVKELIQRYDLTEKDVFGKGSSAKATSKATPKYKNPETGDTWTGRGRTPAWLQGKNKEDFAV